MRSTKTYIPSTLGLLGAIALSACGGAASTVEVPGPTEGHRAVTFEIPDAVAEQYDAEAAADFARLAEDLEEMSEALGLADDPDAVVRVTYLGHGEVVELGEDADLDAEVTDRGAAPAFEEDDGYAFWDTVSVNSGNEFRVGLPRRVLDGAEDRATREGLNRGSDLVSPEDEAMERARPAGAGATDLPTEGVVLEDGTVAQFGLSNAQDTRSLLGTLDVAQTHSAYEKLVDIGGCSGTMFGPKHIVTAAHCVRDFDDSRWVSSTARAGRSGAAWRDSVSFSTSDTWYWTPSQFRSLADGQSSMPFSATPYDIGVIVTHGDRMGDTVGWMGWYWWASDSDFGNRVRYNRGYPLCGRSNSPASCQDNGLYGDSAFCATGEYSSADGDGINRRFRFHCDASAGHSGSSLYHYLDGSTLVVVGVVSWEHCTTCTANDDRPNTGVRITKSYSSSLSWLRQTFP